MIRIPLFLYFLSVFSASSSPSSFGASSSEYIYLEVDKSSLQASLKTLGETPHQSTLLHSFRIAIGKAEGDKEKEGDNRTPEGVYFTLPLIDGKSIPSEKYGPVAIPLNFPNPIDSLQGKTGHGIWLHGAGSDKRIEEAKVTEGCVAFYNGEISKLAQWLKPYQGIVVISSQGGMINRDEDFKTVLARTKSWINAWASRNLNDYISYYAEDFENNGKNKQSYFNYKSAVFKSYKSMSLNIASLRVITHPKYALSVMNQDFRGDQRFRSDGRKILYWKKSSAGDWNIVREVFDGHRLQPITFHKQDLLELGAVQEGGSMSKKIENSVNNNL